MVRSEPCVLFAQTFVHSQLDEYVDEVIFNEPVIITACEFLEQNAASASQAVSLVGATSPPSFALEVFVRCEGEPKFKRLCNPFLYTPSAPYPLEVEAVVTNHLVVRGSYRSLSLVIYGNIVKDLGQYNILLEGRSVTDLVTSAEGNLDDLPLVLHSVNWTIEECVSSLKILSLPMGAPDMLLEVKQLLQLMQKIMETLDHVDAERKVVNTLVSVVSSYIIHDLVCDSINQKHLTSGGSDRELHQIFSEVKKELLILYGVQNSGNQPLLGWNFLESESEVATSKQLVDMLDTYFRFKSDSDSGQPKLSEDKNVLLGLSVALLLCTGRESCFHFVNAGGMEQLVYILRGASKSSTAVTLLLLGVVEQATRHSIGCEGFLGWWPREDGCIPSCKSEGYGLLLQLLMQKPCHDVAFILTHILCRLRVYEVSSRYEFAVLSALGCLPEGNGATGSTSNMLLDAKLQLRKLLSLLISSEAIKDPSAAVYAKEYMILGQEEGFLSYKATSKLISYSSGRFSKSEIDLHLLTLLKAKGFLPLSAALLSSSEMRSEARDALDSFTDIAHSIGAVVLSLMFSRSGLSFLLHNPQVTATIIQSLKGSDELNKEECVPLRYAFALISKGFICSLQEVGMILEMHLRVVSALDRLLKTTPQSEEFLWVLWELRGLSRSDSGREALLALGFFPEAVSILIEALHSVKEIEPSNGSGGASPINIAVFHSAAEIFEVIVSDTTASSLLCWIEHGPELHRALHSSSPGSNRKDAPSRLLKWIDAGVVYHKHGAIGLLRYAAVLASGGDAQLSSTSILALDLTPAENVVGESSTISEINVLENLGKIISEKSFDGLSLNDSSISQLTTAIRILAFISENSSVAAALYDEGAVTVIYAVLVNCSFMLERSSNIYDYLVDDDHECSSISDFLLERNREQSLVDLLVPCLVLLISLLQKLQEATEQHRNTKLMNSLLRLHREVSTKLAGFAADLSSHYPDSALGFGVVCHLIVSALACWPVFGWIPGLFHSLFSGVPATSVVAMGPKETCSLLCLLDDLFPEEGIWLWKNGMPLLSGLRTLAIRTVLGPQKERQIDWYLEHDPLEKLINQLAPHFDRLSQIIQHCALSALEVIQDLLRVFIVRVACQKMKHASSLLQPMLSFIRESVSDMPSKDLDVYKVFRLLDFLASLSEHPFSLELLFEEGIVQIFVAVLKRCYGMVDSDGKLMSAKKDSADFSLLNWLIPVFKSLSLLCSSKNTLYGFKGKELALALSVQDCSSIFPFIVKFCQVLPVGKELVSCLSAFKALVTCNEGKQASYSVILHIFSTSDECESGGDEKIWNSDLTKAEWKKCPPLLSCWTKLLNSVNSKDGSFYYAVEAVKALCLACLGFCINSKSSDMSRAAALKCLFGLPNDMSGTDSFSEGNIFYIQELTTVLISRAADLDESTLQYSNLSEASNLSESLASLLQNCTIITNADDISCSEDTLISTKFLPMEDAGVGEGYDDLYLERFGESFSWECPETLPDRVSQSVLPNRRKLPPVEGSNRRTKGESSLADISAQNMLTRGLGASAVSSAPARRDTFRQRKPNTSRPPSMHVDDYVARERSVDTASNSNAITVPRVGSSSGRPPSIHVDEFMARQRGRQNATAVVGEAVAQVKNAPALLDKDKEKMSKPKPLKADLDDDLQGIDIVFDDEEIEADDKLPFLQPDDNLLQPVSLLADQNSPRSIVEETDSDVNGSSQFFQMGGTPLASNIDESPQSEYSSRMSISRPEAPLTRESSVSSDRKYVEHAEGLKKGIPIKNRNVSETAAGLAGSYSNVQASLLHSPADTRMAPQKSYLKNSPQHAGNIHGTGSRRTYDKKTLLNQPPLPPMPPPSSVSPILPQAPDSVTTQSSPYLNPGTPPPGGSIRPPPPLPSTPPPFSSNPYNTIPPRTSNSQPLGYNQPGAATNELSQSSVTPMIEPHSGGFTASGSGMASYPPPVMSSLVFNRPPSIPVPFFGTISSQQQADKPPNILHSLSMSQSSIQPALPHSAQQLQSTQLLPLQRPLQPPQHLRPPIQTSQPLDQGLSVQNPCQTPMRQSQMIQQLQYSPPVQALYQSQPQVEHSQPQVLHQQGGSGCQQQQETGMSLHEYFKSPEAIQSLLSDRDKLCQLLEQHPKLMQMLQERLGQP